MEAALPVICTKVTLWEEIIEKYQCGICVDPDDVDEIEKALKFLVENKEIAYQMGQNARRAVIEEFNWGNQAALYMKVLERL